MTKPRRALTPVTITEKYTSLRTRKLETWAAVSNDGIWGYQREESSGTPWILEHIPSGEMQMFGTLRAARAATADGSALKNLELRAADRARHGEVA